ncbi:hypothetical protein AK830_g4586 [Neonectria ditissima]|uniref:Heterokaryon incompatibility domain-containing protein n=1 Tax=Neonectria ditissima TaxID=78410 RepID=A0A0P7BN63_9HYPO|nr:hypothetical protein AK830_g4586 [Neonectria ditissima]
MDSKSYQYTAIPQGRWFRLLKIHPGQFGDGITCELFDAELDKAPPYTALSYVWGDPAAREPITCAGQDCNITHSLYEGLRRIRGETGIKTVWADAICINQADNAEKGRQVDLMGTIYEKASKVFVWLGEDGAGSSKVAFTALESVNRKISTGKDKEEIPSTEIDISVSIQGISSGPVTGTRSSLLVDLGASEKECIQKLCQLPWFSRVWVLQEVGLAKSATAFWGDSSIDFSQIAVFILYANDHEDLSAILGPEISSLLSGALYYALWNVWSTYGKESWVQRTPALKAFAELLEEVTNIDYVLILEASRRFSATNPLDHVYAFLGHPKALVPGTKEPWLQANYSLSLEEQHRALASSLCRDSLNYLVQAQPTAQSLEASFQHPSWIPQWNVNHPNTPSAFWECWDASLRLSEKRVHKAEVHDMKLSISAVIIDRIDTQSEVMKPADFEPLMEGGGRLIEQCWDLAMHAQNPYGNEKYIAFASTLACNYKPKGSTSLHYPNGVIQQLVWFCMNANPTFFRKNFLNHGGFWDIQWDNNKRDRFGRCFRNYASHRRFFVTSRGLWGLGPAVAQKGDVCAVLFGADIPFVLRPMATVGEYKLVGECYMYSFMYGEAVRACESGAPGCSKEEILLV